MPTLDQESIDYFRARERIELDAADSAPTEAARRAHFELAQGYAALVRRGDAMPAGRETA